MARKYDPRKRASGQPKGVVGNRGACHLCNTKFDTASKAGFGKMMEHYVSKHPKSQIARTEKFRRSQ